MTKSIKITVSPTIPDNFLHELDANVAGEYSIAVISGMTPEQENEAALDLFHRTYPIKRLDDFCISAPESYYACPDCGCTDVEATAWYYINANTMTNDEGPLDQVFCPECSINGIEGLMKWHDLVQTRALKPITKENEL